MKQMRQLLKKTKGESTIVGLELAAGSIGAAEVAVNGAVRVSAAAVQPIPPEAFRDGEVADPEVVAAGLRTLFSDNKLSRRVRLGVANQRVVVRTLRLPAIDDPKELDSAVRFAAQEQLPMPLEHAVLEHKVVGGVPAAEGAPPQIDVIVVAARRDMISATLRPIKEAGLEPLGVDLSAFAMLRAVAAPGSPDTNRGGQQDGAGAVLYCNVGDVTNLAVARDRSCLFTRVSPVGLGDVADKLATSLGLTHEHANQWISHVGLATPVEEIQGDPAVVAAVRDALELAVNSLEDELRLSIDFYGGQEDAMPIERLVLCGPGSAVAGMAERLGPGVGRPVELARPEALSGLGPAMAARLTVPYGLALNH